MCRFQAGLPKLRVLIVLFFCLISIPFPHYKCNPFELTAENTPSQLQAVTQIIPYDFISETVQAQSNHGKVIRELWVGVAYALVGIAVSFRHRRHEHLSDSIPTSREFLLNCIHDQDGKKR